LCEFELNSKSNLVELETDSDLEKLPPIRSSKNPVVLKGNKDNQDPFKTTAGEPNSAKLSKKSTKPKDYSEWAKLDAF
jgi:hypothetical protein